MKALPRNERDILHLHRHYISTIIYSLVGKPFREWVDKRIVERNQKLEEKHNMTVMLDPEVAAILQKSTTVSSKSNILVLFCDKILIFFDNL